MHVATRWQAPKLVGLVELKAEVKRLLRVVQHRTRRPAPEPLDIFPGNARTSLLIKWAQAACMLQPGMGGVKVTDFKASFGDGRVLCYLVREVSSVLKTVLSTHAYLKATADSTSTLDVPPLTNR